MSQFHHPFFDPMWRRVATTAVLLCWAAFEFSTNEPFWGMLFGGIGAYAAHQFFLAPRTPPSQ